MRYTLDGRLNSPTSYDRRVFSGENVIYYYAEKLLFRHRILRNACIYIYASSSKFSLPFEGRETLREVGFFSPLEKTSRGRTLVVDTISIHEENFNAVKGGYDEEIWLLFVPKRATLKLGISIENIVVRLLYINHELIPNFARILSFFIVTFFKESII